MCLLRRSLLGFVLALSPLKVLADIEAVFHPDSSSLSKVAARLKTAQHTIELALYNIDVEQKNPVIAGLGSPEMQRRIKDKTLIIRMLFEGYGTPQENAAKARAMEDLGVDVRFLKGGLSMHHKFGIIDAGTENASLVTGSANWSLKSQNFYDENILFAKDETALLAAFSSEFALLWRLSEEFGNVGPVSETVDRDGEVAATSGDATHALFNSANFDTSGKSLRKKPLEQGFVMTKQLVSLIDSAQDNLKIATTRIKLYPAYDALLRAAKRGVKIDLLVNLDQYTYFNRRKAQKAPNCKDPFDPTCSSGEYFAHFLDSETYPGRENVTVRVKFYGTGPASYLAQQMHHKYMIVDDETLVTGSFNWSYSSEYQHIENLIVIAGDEHPSLLASFKKNFGAVFSRNRSDYQGLIKRFDEALKTNDKTNCNYPPLSLTFGEIDAFLEVGRPYKKSVQSACGKEK